FTPALVATCLASTLFSRMSLRHPPWTHVFFPYTTLFRSERRLTARRLTHDRHRLRPSIGAGDRHRRRRRHRPARSSGIPVDLARSEEHTSELQSRFDIVCRPLLGKKK